LAGTTQYTTTDININFGTRFHVDGNDWRKETDDNIEVGGFSCIKAFKDEIYVKGGILLLPRFNIGFDISHEGCVFVQSWRFVHGNTPIFHTENENRATVVAFTNKQVVTASNKTSYIF